MHFSLSKIGRVVIPLCSAIALNACFDDDSTIIFPEANRPDIDIVIPEVNGPTAILPQAGDVKEPIVAGAKEAVIYYVAKNNASAPENFSNYSLHLWNNDTCDKIDDSELNASWDDKKVAPAGEDEFGPYWKIKLKDGNTDCINFIVRDDNLNNMLGSDAKLELDKISDAVASFVPGSTEAYDNRADAYLQISAVANAAAHLIEGHTLLWDGSADATDVRLYLSLNGDIKPNDEGQYKAQYIQLTPTTLSEQSKAKFKHLADKKAFAIDPSINMRPIIKAQLVVMAVDKKGVLIGGTKVQTAGALDNLFATAAKEAHLGAVINSGSTNFALWAPSAQSVQTVLFDADKKEIDRLAMSYDDKSGIWSLSTTNAPSGTYYRYLINVFHPASDKVESYQVTDPYSLSLSVNSEYSQVVDLDDPALKPAGWDTLKRPISQKNPADFVIYESHVRDFSALDKSTDPDKRGKFIAFTQQDSVPNTHLRSLSESGVTHLHLLPIFDIATINEDPSKVANIDEEFSKLCNLDEAVRKHDVFGNYCQSGQTILAVLSDLKASDTKDNPIVQELNRFVSNNDNFNWGYDPFHYTVPEGSYSTNADGTARIKELREAIMAIKNDTGMNVVMDVVYNHTNAAGPVSRTSVLDKIVPWYYQRLNATTGNVENSTCCSNTAPEHEMFEKLISDSLVTWSRDYKIDAYRFDLMGHHPLAQMQRSLEAVRAVDPDTYFYGEGWDFGEIAGDARFIQARQAHLGGTGIGSFSDRLRDAVRGGAYNDDFNNLRFRQGFGNGAYVMPTEDNQNAQDANPEKMTKERALHLADLVRLGMAGNLKSYSFEDAKGNIITGDMLDYNGQPAGYAQDPSEIQNYVSKHDNQTLWDFNQYKLPYSLTTEERVRAQVVGLATAMLGQGMPFTHMGVELLRSKSMQRDSYDSGDYFNFVDFTLEDNNWDKGLPRKDKDGDNYALIDTILEETGDQTKPLKEHMEKMVSYYKELALIRKSYPLIRLGSGEEIKKRVRFHNTGVDQIPGLIVMSIDGEGLNKEGSALSALVIAINATPKEIHFGWDKELNLSAHHQSDLAQDATYRDGNMIIPAWTPVVFEQK